MANSEHSLVGLAVGGLVEAVLAYCDQLVGRKRLEVGRHLVDPGLQLLRTDGVGPLVAGLIHQVPGCAQCVNPLALFVSWLMYLPLPGIDSRAV